MEFALFVIFAFVFLWATTGGRTPSFLRGRVPKLESGDVDLEITVRRLEVRESGKVADPSNTALWALTDGFGEPTTHYVTEYTVVLPAWFVPLEVGDLDSVAFYHLNSHGSPTTSDHDFNGSFEYLAPPTPKAKALLEIAELREMLTTISHSLGAVRIDGRKLIFRDTGGTSESEVGITRELIRELLDAIPKPRTT